jgi:hypothetical protein
MVRWWAALVAVAAIVVQAHAGDLTADEIMRRNIVVDKVSDSRAEVTMTLVSESGARRERSTVLLSKLMPNGVDQKRLVRFSTPPDVKGTATLLIEHADADDDIWIFLPALHKVRRLVANNKKDSFVGTDFSYGDIIGQRVESWSHTLVGTEQLDGAETYVVDSVPLTDAVREISGYAKRRTWIRSDNFVAVRALYWDTAEKPLKELRAADVRETDPAHHKWQGFRVTMRNTQTGHSTEIVWMKLEVGVGLSDDVFTERELEKEN